MADAVIKNCGSEALRGRLPQVRFSFVCSKRWEALAATEGESVRFCQQCQERVYYCETIDDAETRALAGQCIAVPQALSDGGVESLAMGRPDPVMDWGTRLFTYGAGSRDALVLLVIYSEDPSLPGRSFVAGPADPVTTVGRGVDNTIVLASDAASRNHARFERRGDVWWVVDVGSTNGTYVNDERVQEAALQRGDRVQIGRTIFKLGDTPTTPGPGFTVSDVDGLTGLHNRRWLGEEVERALQRPEGRPLALVVFDIDRFKAVNDDHGHLVGDQVLRELTGLMRTFVRAGDGLARHAGDRFALLLPATDQVGATAIAEQVRAAIGGHGFTIDDRSLAVTVSAGVACAGDVRSFDGLLRSAEADLLAARGSRRL